jgi:hypothetical protein
MELLGKLRVNDLESKLAKVSLGIEKGFKILLDNDAKMYRTICRLGKAQTNPWKCDNYGSTYPMSP